MTMKAERAILAEHWTELMRRWTASGLSGAAWCREQEVVYAQFCYWRRRLQPAAASESREAFVTLAAESGAAESGVRICLGEGLAIVVARGFDAECLVRTVRALRAGSC